MDAEPATREPASPAEPVVLDMELPAKAPAASIIVTVPEPLPTLAVDRPLDRPAIGAPASRDPVSTRGLWNWVLPGMFFLSMLLLVLYATPYLLMHWRMLEAQGEAEATFLKRRAELRAEAEHADARLVELDKRVQLTSLGFRELVRKVAPHVVNVACFKELPKDRLAIAKARVLYDPDTDSRYLETGVGSGIVIRPGVILTNHHVIDGAERLRLTFASGQVMGISSTSISADDITDLAIIRLPANLPAGLKQEADASAVFADSDKDVQVGDWALAIGSPLGLRQTVTQGVISAKGRLLEPTFDLVELLQTDAAINPGNSGGPLFDQMGRLVGINVAIASDEHGRGQGIGFAIPSNTVKKIADELLAKGEVRRGYLGVALDDVPGPLARTLKIDDGAVLLKDVLPKQPASAAGLMAGDIVVGVNNERLSRQQPTRHFRQLIVDLEPGSQASFEIVRDQQHRSIDVTIGRRPAQLNRKANPK
jgi:S1-C subfamily serine protease